MNTRVLLLNPAPSLIKYGMKCGFEQNGCFTHLLEGDEAVFMLHDNEDEQIKRIEKAIIQYGINTIFSEGYAGMPLEKISELCRKKNVKFHFWCIEDPVTPHIGEFVASNKLVDFIWTTTQEFLPKYEGYGIPTDILLFACNPDFHKPVLSEDRFKHDMSLVGTNYSNRYDKIRQFIFPIIEADFDIKIYGLWWERPELPLNLLKYQSKNIYWREHPQLPYEWLPIVINSSKIMLGINCSDISITQTSCRPYETLASSGESVYLSYYTKAQENIFGNYMIQAKTGEEMIELANDILSWSDVKRRAFAANARDFVVNNHTYKNRALQVLKALGE